MTASGLEKSFLCQSQNCLGCHFSGRIFFQLGRNRAPRLKSLGAKKRSYLWGHLLDTPGHERHQWNDSKLLFFWQWKSMKAKKKKKKKRKEKKKKLQESKDNFYYYYTRKQLGPLHSHETLRGRGRSYWIKADKKFESRAKRKRKRRKRKENAPTCVNRLGTTTAGSSNFDCNNARSRCWNPLCWHDLGLVALPTALCLQRFLVSFVRGTCVLRLCRRFHRQESGFRRCDL